MIIVETRGLGRDYGDLAAVVGLDLEVVQGEIFGLLGPNGAGKTTAISMLCGVVTPSRGSVRIAGFDLAREPFDARRALGLVPQELALYEDITARQNLTFFAGLYGIAGPVRAERIAWVLAIAGLSDRADEPVKRYSGGMKRRLNLAAGLLHRPQVLVLDEPTVGVDPQSRNHIFETVRQLQREHQMTVIYTSHYMEEVEALCDRVAIMDRGEVIAQGRIEDMIADHGGGSLQIEFDGDPGAVERALADVRDQPGHGDLAWDIDGQLVRVLPVAGDTRGAIAAGDADGASAGAETTDTSGAGRRYGAPLGAIVSAVDGAAGARVTAIRTVDADLETVFLDVTGRRLRDE